MRKTILIGILTIALVVGFGTVIIYNQGDYELKFNLKESIPHSDILVTLYSQRYGLPAQPSVSSVLANFTDKSSPFYQLFKNSTNQPIISSESIVSFSVSLGGMTFENPGSFEKLIEFPRLAVCLELTTNSINYPVWPVYTHNGIETYSGYSVNSYSDYYGSQTKIKPGEELEYQISLKDAYVNILGSSSEVFRNSKIKVYNIPAESFNPISPEAGYDSLNGNSNCNVLAGKLEPIKTITVI